MNKVYPGTIYGTFYEKLRDKDGESSTYNYFLSCDGSFTITLSDKHYSRVEKSVLIEKVEKFLDRNVYRGLEGFTVKETDYGWEYERYVKWIDKDTCEVVEKGQHTDHELFTVDLSFYEETPCILKEINKAEDRRKNIAAIMGENSDGN
jgi:hypothetical protein